MRPLTLRIRGFRSWKEEVLIDFTDLSLFAITGSNGAGKSSILEAMTWAGYGASTWEQKNHGELLSDGARSMAATLTFRGSQGRVWEVSRNYMRSGSGGAKLKCLSDENIPVIDGARNVDKAVVDAAGLTYEQFLRCVIVPQGRFERILCATPAERVEVQRGVFGLGVIEEIRADAADLARTVLGREREITEARSRFLPDPADTARDAARNAAAAKDHLASLEATHLQVTELETAAQDAESRHRDSLRAAQGISDHGTGHADRARELAGAATGIQAQIAQAIETANTATANLEQCKQEADAARAEGRDPVALERAAGNLTAIAELADRVWTLQGQARAGEDDINQKTATATELAASCTEATGTDCSQLDPDALDHVLSRMRDNAQQEQQAVQQARTLAEQITDLADQSNSLTRDLENTRRQVDQSNTEADKLEGETRGIAEELAAAERASAAAHAGEGCAPGQPCPVCDRELPATFQAPSVPDGIAQLRGRRDSITQEAQTARARATAGTETLERLETEHAQRSQRHTVAVQALVEIAHAHAASTPVDAATDPHVMVTLIDQATHATREQLSRAEQAVSELKRSLADIALARQTHHNLQGQAQTEHTRLDQSLAGLPAFLGAPSTIGPPDDDRLADRGRLEALLSSAREKLQVEEQCARDAAERARAGADAATTANAKLAELREQLSATITRPLASLHSEIRAIARATTAAGGTAPPEPDGVAETPSAFADWAGTVENTASHLLAQLAQNAQEAEQAAATKRAEAQTLLDRAGQPNASALASVLGEARHSVNRHEETRAEAEAQIKPVEELEGLLRDARSLHQALDGLHRALSTGQFTLFAMEHRQRALLVHASRLLEEMTGRYAFTEDFLVLDMRSGEARGPRTLSGGEMFLASLALALGLAEIAGRTGSAVGDALFLDEGFGNLDPDSLDAALTVLERRADAGRLIGMISHVPVIAERIPTRLEVKPGPAGSKVHLHMPQDPDEDSASFYADEPPVGTPA